MTTTSTRVRRSRDSPAVKPILDRNALVKALDDFNISLKAGQLDLFYQLLHRQHYPVLPEFVDTYYKNENQDENVPPSQNLPLKNPVSSRNRNGGKQLPKKFLDYLQNTSNFVTCTSTVQTAQTSADGSTTKLAIRLHDGHVVESVIMRYTSKTSNRATLCVSSQVGCAMGCTFCATGTMGIRGNLSSGEILEQLVHAGRILAKETDKNKPDLVRNVVFMGMGEPLNNYNNVLEACRSLLDRSRWNLAHGRVTVSTVGVTPKMKKLTRDLPQVSLALSLHAPNQAMRSAIVPAAKNYPIEGMIEALDEHMMATCKHKKQAVTKQDRIQASKRKRAMIEYVMLEGDTSTLECAHQLGKLCENRHLVVNLIPYNQTDVKDKLNCPSEVHMKEFHRIVSSYGAFCTIRRTMGADITGACGQLVVEEEKKQNVNDIEDGPFENERDTRERAVSGASKLSSRTTSSRESSTAASYRVNDSTGEGLDDDTRKVDASDVYTAEWIRPLTIATSVAATCFLLSSILFLGQQRQRR